MAREVLVDKDGLATGVSYIDKKTNSEVQVRGKDCDARREQLRNRPAAARIPGVRPIPMAWAIPMEWWESI